jgi:uncharacterized protein (DUF2336 family)
MFKKLFSKNKTQPQSIQKQERDPERYEVERETARSQNAKDRLKLAQNPQTHLEILYYLADDQDTKVRRAVASNPATPVHVSEILANDDDTDVKLALIKRLVALLPDLSKDQYAHLYAFSVQALGILALDEVLKVRLALSSALRDETYAPPEVVNQLARDLERRVSEPILKFCTAVTDEALIDILIQHPDDWVIDTIAGRSGVSGSVSKAVFETKNVKAGRTLIENKSAEIDDETLDLIIDLARETPEWHKPLAIQSHLPSRVIKNILAFVDKSIQSLIFARTDLDDLTRKDLINTVDRRVNFLVDEKGNKITAEQKVLSLTKAGQLNDDAVRDALALREYDVVYYALVAKSKLTLPTVKKMIDTQSAKAVTAVVWKAGLEMRTALEIQKTIAKIQPRDMLYPRNGNEFPLSESDMKFQIDFFAGD